MIIYHLLALLAGCVLDWMVGDPHWLPHPVRIMGRLITFLEKRFRASFAKDEKSERLAGGCMVLAVLLITGLVAFFVLAVSYRITPFLGVAVESVMCGQMMAFRSLKKESGKVFCALKAKEVEQARAAVSMIVGRDTSPLTEEGIAKAAVETVAENTSDGIIAPLLFMAVGGGVAIFLYKAVNTMDSMVGYRNEAYENFGWAAAKLDDGCNYVPARICAAFMIATGFLLEGFERLRGEKGRNQRHYRGMGGLKIFKRDRYKHKSPNSAQTESVCAGVLGIRLAGDAWYFGKLLKKPFIGDELRRTQCQDIMRACRLMEGTYLLVLAFTASALWLLVKWNL